MSEYHKLEGKGSWVQAHKVNKWGKYAMQLHLSPKSLDYARELIAEKGLMNKISKDDEGWFIRLSRPSQITLKTGKIVGVTPPEILDGQHPIEQPDGKVIFPPLIEPIGNGSDVIAKVELYSYNDPMNPGKKKYAMRWDSLLVNNLVPFNKKSFDDDLVNANKGLEDHPKQAGW